MLYKSCVNEFTKVGMSTRTHELRIEVHDDSHTSLQTVRTHYTKFNHISIFIKICFVIPCKIYINILNSLLKYGIKHVDRYLFDVLSFEF